MKIGKYGWQKCFYLGDLVGDLYKWKNSKIVKGMWCTKHYAMYVCTVMKYAKGTYKTNRPYYSRYYALWNMYMKIGPTDIWRGTFEPFPANKHF